MIEKIQKINSPLSIFLMFGVVIEIGITALYPFLSVEDKGLFIYFIITFPFILLFSFIGLMWFRPGSLYGPSDFQTDEAYLEALKGTKVFVERYASETEVGSVQFPKFDGKYAKLSPTEFEKNIGNPIKMMFNIQKELNKHLKEDAFEAGSIEFHGKIWYLTVLVKDEFILQPKKGSMRHLTRASRVIEINSEAEYKFSLVDTNQISRDIDGLIKLISDDIWLSFEQVIDPAKKRQFDPAKS